MKGERINRWEDFKTRFHDIIEKQILEEKPYKVALGCSLGIGINFFPTMGVGFVFAYLLASLFQISRVTATATSLLTGPLVPLMYALNFVIGGLILSPVTGKENLIDFIVSQYTLSLSLGHVQDRILGFIELIGTTFLVGAAVNAVFFGTAFYFFVVSKMRNKRMKNP